MDDEGWSGPGTRLAYRSAPPRRRVISSSGACEGVRAAGLMDGRGEEREGDSSR